MKICKIISQCLKKCVRQFSCNFELYGLLIG